MTRQEVSANDRFLEALEAWANVYVGRSLSEYFGFLKKADISLLQAYALTFLHYQAPSKISEICEHMMVTAAAASQMVDRLENQNLVTRIPDPGDRRVRNVVLSKQGDELVRHSIRARRDWVKGVPMEISEEQMNQISSALLLLVSIFQEE